MKSILNHKMHLTTKVSVLTLILLVSIASPMLLLSASAAATVTLTTTSGPNGTSVRVSGAGFGLNEAASALTITVNGLSTKVASNSLSTNSTGGLTGSFVIGGFGSLNLSPGVYSIQISDSSAAPQAASFTVTAPTVTLTPTTGPAGTSVLIAGSGFATGTNQITAASFAGTKIYQLGTLSAFSGVVTLSASATATGGSPYTLAVSSIALTNTSNVVATATLTPGSAWTGNGSLSGTWTPVLTGSSATATGSFSGAVAVADIGTTNVETVTATISIASFAFTTNINQLSSNTLTSGSYSGTVSLPAVTSGSSFTLTDNFGNVATATYTLNAPTVTLSPTSGPVGTVITATLAGFGPGATVASVKIGNAAPLDTLAISAPTSPSVTEQGTSAFLFTVTSAGDANFAAGAQAITVTDSLGDVAMAAFTITPTATMTLGVGATNSLVAAAPAGTANVLAFLSVNGFKPSTALSFTATAGVPAGWLTWTSGGYPGVTTDASGSATGAVSGTGTAPSFGLYYVTVSDGTNQVQITLNIVAAGTSFFGITPSSGVQGTTVTVIGFGATSTAINYDGVAVAGATQCVGNTWPAAPTPAGSFNVPTSTIGTHSVTTTGISGIAPFIITGSPTISVVSPSANAAIGTTITIVGSGFAKSASLGSLTIDSLLTVVPSYVTFTAQGNMLATFVVPTIQSAVPHVITITDSSLNTATASFTSAVSSITLTPAAGVVSWKNVLAVLITGSGFPMNQAISVTFSGATVFSLNAITNGVTKTNTNGGILIYNTSIPATVLTTNGAHTVTVTAGSAAATASFTVNANITLSTTLNVNLVTAVRAPAVVPISGAGFAANSGITVTLAGTAVQWYNTVTQANATSITTDAAGSIPTASAIIIPATQAAGNIAIAVTDASGNTASVTLTVLATPAITLGAAQAIAGVGTIGISGTGFTPGSRGVTVNVLQGTTVVASNVQGTSPITVTSTGALPSSFGAPTETFAVPNVAAGVYTVNLTTTNLPIESAVANFTILGAPTVATNLVSGVAGTNVTLTVVGLSTLSTVTLGGTLATMVTSNGTLGTTTVPSTGANAYNLTTWILVPPIPSGTYTLLVSDGPRDATTVFTVTTSLSLTLPVGGALKGTTVTVTGTGFGPAGTAYNVTVNGALIATAAGTTTTGGNVSTSFSVPITAKATGNVVALTDALNNTQSATFAVTAPTITLNPTTGQTGTTVQIIGNAFTPSAALIVEVGTTIVTTSPANVAANAGGSFIAYINIPTGLSGNQTITVIDSSNNVATAVFAVSPGTGGGIVVDQSSLASTAQTLNSAGQPATSFARGSTVKLSFVLDSTSGSGNVVWRVTLQQGTAVYNIATTTASISTTPSTLTFTQLIPTTVSAGTWTASIQIFASDGVTPLGVATLTFSVT